MILAHLAMRTGDALCRTSTRVERIGLAIERWGWRRGMGPAGTVQPGVEGAAGPLLPATAGQEGGTLKDETMIPWLVKGGRLDSTGGPLRPSIEFFPGTPPCGVATPRVDYDRELATRRQKEQDRNAVAETTARLQRRMDELEEWATLSADGPVTPGCLRLWRQDRYGRRRGER